MKVALRKFDPELDSKEMYDLRCDEEVDRFSIKVKPTWTQHQDYISQGRANNIIVATYKGQFAGCVKAKPMVNVMVKAEFRGCGVGTKLIESIQKNHDDLVALVHQDNYAAQHLFGKTGFHRTESKPPWINLMWMR